MGHTIRKTPLISRLSHIAEYVLVLLLAKVLNALPRSLTLRIGSIAGLILYHSGFYHRIVFGNMRHVALWDEKQMRSLAKSLYRNIGRYIADFFRSQSPLPPHRIHHYEIIERALAYGKGSLVLLAHTGNWELLGNIFGRRVSNLSVVAKPMKNGLVDAWLANKRASTMVTTIYLQHAVRRMMRSVMDNGMVAILIDQHIGKQGTPVPFLGKQASTVRTVAGLAYRSGCTVFAARSVLCPDGSYDIYIEEAPVPDMAGKTEDEAISAIQLQHNDIISSWIIENPDHWFGWFHKRFRGTAVYS